MRRAFLRILFSSLFIFINISCDQNKINKAEIFIKNVDEKNIILFSNNRVIPVRSGLYLLNEYIFDEYDTTYFHNILFPDTSDIHIFDIQNKDSLLLLFNAYQELDVLGIYGFCRFRGYIEIMIDRKNVLIYLCDKSRFSLNEYCDYYVIEMNSITNYNDKWIYYKLPKGRYFAFD